MTQSLSAMNYIRNNKRRISVLIVSLTLCYVLTYLTSFLLSVSMETFKPALLENTKKVQIMSIASSSFGLDVDNTSDEVLEVQYVAKVKELVGKLKETKGVEEAYNVPNIYNLLQPPIGMYTFEVPLVPEKEVVKFLKRYDAELIEGRMPENPGEVIVDEASMKNNGFVLNGYFREDVYKQDFKIVGVVKCSSYFVSGTPGKDTIEGYMIAVISDGSIEDFRPILRDYGVNVRDNYDRVYDYVDGVKQYKENVTDQINQSSDLIYIGVIVLLSILLFIVYTSYLRDRRNEWCLYCSIGYSKKTIYFSILRELLFAFGVSIAIGSVVIGGSVLVIDYAMIQPMGLKCRYLNMGTITEIFSTYVMLIGVLHIPIMGALYKIRTIDAIEDDLY